MADDPGAAATTHEVIDLWSDPPPRTIEGVPPESTFSPPAGLAARTTMLRNVSHPTLTVYRPTVAANGSSVVVCPGGGWSILAWTHEGTDVAEWFAARGYTAFLLKYRVSATPADPLAFAARMARNDSLLSEPLTAARAPKAMGDIVRDERLLYARDIAADDGRRALAVVRQRAGEYGLDPERIGMIGFSAGAFLIVDVAMDPQGPPPAFIAPIYGGETRGRPVPADAPPIFTVIAHDDRLLFHMVEGLYLDWSAADRPSELHIFARGTHGFGMVRQGAPSDRWIDLLGAWLADNGFG
ncbi:MAG: alpha/beta hydrolase fold domain-containing protein [Phenylobacterium sp.]|uniref:alpha/beta hydrolase n=1 Tax=Phenylobacterium sp. TaxID=1871053 RepID=UPI001A515809|nr:dienelactone hydrolase family protein [Phenylobacterium sp.]MBL8554365.1 alpha/beta hydrolase fold domain-containing protein [Phenylobacterium sp.]